MPLATAAIRCPHLSARVPADADQSAAHLGAEPIGRIAMDGDQSAGHGSAEMHPCIAMDYDASPGHIAPNHLNLCKIPVKLQTAVPFALYLEEIAQLKPPSAEEHRQLQDLVPRQAAYHIGSEDFGLQRQLEFFFEL